MQPYNVLVVEDNPVDFKSLQRLCKGVNDFHLIHTENLSSSFELVETESVDIALLDLSLPDSSGLQTVRKLASEVAIPIVVLSGTQEKGIALQAIQQGAQDYLLKDNLDKQVLIQTLRYAIARSRRLSHLFESRESALRDRELRRLQDEDAYTDVRLQTDSANSNGSLETDFPECFHQAVKLYSELLAHALKRRSYPSLTMDMGKQLNRLGMVMGEHNATPKDAIKVHTVSVEQTLELIAPNKNAICHAEARYLLSGLLGHLCYYYRANWSLPSPNELTEVDS